MPRIIYMEGCQEFQKKAYRWNAANEEKVSFQIYVPLLSSEYKSQVGWGWYNNDSDTDTYCKKDEFSVYWYCRRGSIDTGTFNTLNYTYYWCSIG